MDIDDVKNGIIELRNKLGSNYVYIIGNDMRYLPRKNVFDDFFDDSFYGNGNLMKTDIKELDNGYELEIDLPGFKKDENKAE